MYLFKELFGSMVKKHPKSRSDKRSVVCEALCECGIYEALHITNYYCISTDRERKNLSEQAAEPAVQVTPQRSDKKSLI